MKVAIIGSRTGFTKEFVFLALEAYSTGHEFWSKIYTGGAIGVDTFAIEWGAESGIKTEIIRPIPYDIGYGIPMNYIFRNIEILTKADKVYAFWDGKSRGTMSVIKYCQARGKDITIISPECS